MTSTWGFDLLVEGYFEVRSNRLVLLSVVLLGCTLPMMGQNTGASAAGSYPFLLHMETMTFDDQVCVLLRRDGQFHLEEERGDRTRVFEGALSPEKMIAVLQMIENDALRQLSQKQIVRPAGNIILDELHVDVFRGDHWQDLFFPDVSTRRPFDRLLAPLVQWFAILKKEPHTELSEDVGKNDCQLPKRIVLKLRKPAAANAPRP